MPGLGLSLQDSGMVSDRGLTNWKGPLSASWLAGHGTGSMTYSGKEWSLRSNWWPAITVRHSLLRTVCLRHGQEACPSSWCLYSFLYSWHTLEVNLKTPLTQLWPTIKGVDDLLELPYKTKILWLGRGGFLL